MSFQSNINKVKRAMKKDRRVARFMQPKTRLYRQIARAEAKKQIVRSLEKKFVDTIAINAAVGYDAPLIYKLTSIQQGTADASQRIGDEITYSGLHLNLSCHADSIETQFRVVIFEWKDDDAAGGPVVGNVLQSGGSNVTFMSPWNHDNGAQYSIVYDKSFVCMPGQSNGYRQDIKTMSLSAKNLVNFDQKLHFNAAGATGKNHLYMLVTTRNLVASGDNFTFTSRVTYRDG